MTTTWVRKADGTAWYWGYGTASYPPPPSLPATQATWLPPDTAHIFLHSDMMCTLSASHDLRCALSPNDVGCARSPAGQFVCDGGQPNIATAPLPAVAQVAMGFAAPVFPAAATNCAVKLDGTVWCFESTDPATAVYQDVPFGNDVTSVSVSSDADRCVIKTDGSVWCHHDIVVDWTDYVQAALPAPATAVAVGPHITCAVLKDGTLWCGGCTSSLDQTASSCFGAGSFGLQPAAVGIADVKAVVMGMLHLCALKNDGSVWCWGDNTYGACGVTPAGPGALVAAPTQVAELGNDVTQIAAGFMHTCARKGDGTIWCWGDDEWGQLGGNAAVNASPVQMRGCE